MEVYCEKSLRYRKQHIGMMDGLVKCLHDNYEPSNKC
jgi:hypothetical protein